MRNLDIARAFVTNALAYLRDRDLDPKTRVEIATANLEEVDRRLRYPDDDDPEVDGEDFK